MATNRNDWRTEEVNDLCRALLSLDTVDEMAAFLRDLCTVKELSELSGRWAVVRSLADGLPYREVARATGVSTATVTRVNQWLTRGTGGYQLALDREQEPR